MEILWKNFLGSFSLFCLCFLAIILVPSLSWAITIPNYNPRYDDNNGMGKNIVISGTSETVEASDLSSTFISGDKPAATSEKLNDLNSVGKVTDPNNILGEKTLALGNLNYAISIPDPITGGSRSMSVYKTSNIAISANTIGERNVNVYDNVNNMQYININIAEIDSTGGTMDVELGDLAETNQKSATNHLNLAAKQSTLFKADGTTADATVNWNTNNRVTFFGAYVDPSGTSTYNAHDIPIFGGTFTFTTKAGNSYTKTVTDDASLKSYNDWLIGELQAGTLESDEYENLFNKGVILENKSLTYEEKATLPDEIFEPIGDRIIIKASGEKAVVNIKAKLEGENATTAVKLENGANLVIEAGGSLGNTNGAVVTMDGTSGIINNGVINANFLTKADGSYESSGASNVTSITVSDETSFINNGIFNIETNGGAVNTVGLLLKNTAVAAAGTGYLATTDGLYYSAGNSGSGIINVGVSSESSSGSTTGVLIDSKESSFINEGEIYLGRTNQNAASDPTTDTSINQRNFLTGIKVQNNGKAINAGLITINSKVQNGVGMLANGGQDIVMQNTGIITLTDNSTLGVPNTNYGMLVQNAGANGGIEHAGTINLAGINGIGLKVISNSNKKASAKTAVGSLIDIKGDADPISGTRNYGVWVEGQGSQTATAELDGKIKLEGDGAIGIHARGKATIDVSNDAIPEFVSGEKQIAFFAYGTYAQINLTGGTAVFDVTTNESTMFRLENGAGIFYASNLEITTSGDGSKGIVGSGIGTEVDLMGATFNVTGEEAIGVIVEGGATGKIVNQTEFNLDGDKTVGILVDGEKHDLADKVQNTVQSNVIAETKMVNNGSSDVTGFIVKNISSLTVNAGSTIEFLTGTNNTGIKVESGSTLINNGSIAIADGTGISVSGENSKATNKANIEIDNGTGMFITDKAVAIGVGDITVSNGVAGVHLSNGGILNVSQGTHTITTDGTAHGILLDIGTTGILVTNLAIDVQGTGHGIENKAETQAITLNNTVIDVTNGAGIRTAVTIDPNSTATVNVAGSGIGFAFVQADMVTETSGDLLLGPNYTFNVNGANGTGILALTTGNVITSGNVNVTHASGGSALVAGTADTTLNLGKLESLSTTSPVVDLSNNTLGTTFENQGTILAASALDTAILGSAVDEVIYLTAGEVRGDISSGEGNDALAFTGGTLEGSLTMGNGENEALIRGVSLKKTSHVTSGTSGKNALILQNVTVEGSTMAGGDDSTKGVNFSEGWNSVILDATSFTLTGDLTLDDTVQDAELYISAGSTLVSNNGVTNSIMPKAVINTLTVINKGLIDLTTVKDKLPSSSPQFQDALAIVGNYVGGGALYMDTYLNAGGALANQETDRVLIFGDASATTLIDFNLTHKPGMDSGAAGTDLNGDGVVQSNEGISIVQVLGNANDSSFKLKNGYVASGAFSYGLYSFDHAAADTSQNLLNGAGNSFYDFRLANNNVLPLNRPQVIPQVPSYLSNPMANAIYNNMVIDDLHKRLGELRYNSDGMSSGDKDGTRRGFLRYIGGKYDYNSNVSGSNFGYDFELSFNAMQLGFNLLDLADELNDGLQAGVAWTHGRSTVRSESPYDGYSKAKIDADTVGLYATYQHEQNLYFDAVLAGTWSRSKINTDVHPRASTLKSFGWSASVESGYALFPLENKSFKLEPQAQLTYYHEKTKDSVDADGAVIKYENNNQLFGRLGLRAAYAHTKESGLKLTPYAVANYYTNFGGSAPNVNIANALPSSPGYNFNTGKMGDSIEGGLGLTVEATNGLSVYTEVDYRKGLNGNGIKGWRGDVGLKFSF